jgi:hypothetical protein
VGENVVAAEPQRDADAPQIGCLRVADWPQHNIATQRLKATQSNAKQRKVKASAQNTWLLLLCVTLGLCVAMLCF